MSAASRAAGIRRRYRVRGVVQGVGFRPFVWTLASRLGLDGSVRNTSGSVLIEVQGTAVQLDTFAARLCDEAPPLARIASLEAEEIPPRRARGFRILDSSRVAGEHQPVSPDAATCADCLAELNDPANRRHHYPFINCTSCGPRFTIIEDLPYDRRSTTMRRFVMCELCRAEYENPADRRFHAQPNACWTCGPRVWFASGSGDELPGDAVALAARAVIEGRVVAIKGLGGFQLCCDATSDDAVRRLRVAKRRPAKPFAIMTADLTAAAAMCDVSPAEERLLVSPAHPIVLLAMRERDGAHAPAPSIAPGLRELGVMLPYTPLHHLLMQAVARPLVMTSGNLSEEPIARDNAEAIGRLQTIAEAFVLHDRDIHARYDDSVMRHTAGAARVLRRARGLAPLPVAIDAGTEVLALGAHLKNTFCIVKEHEAFVGPHIGDLDNPLALQHLDETLAAYMRLFRARPRTVACDLHPDYASTRLAEERCAGGPGPVRVQHHHAHVASVMAEHGLRGRVLGVAFDGVGLGPDGTIWGGELLLCDERSYRRVGQLAAVPQPGGDACAREGWRMAAAYLAAAGAGETMPDALAGTAGAPDARRWRLVSRLARSDAAPVSTSAGRLFDAVAGVLGVAGTSSYEAEAAMRLEAAAVSAGACAAAPAAPLAMGGAPLVIDTVALVAWLASQRRRGRPAEELALVFHETLARGLTEACDRLAAALGVHRVAVSGGVFQNALLLSRVTELMSAAGLRVYANEAVPANDGGISLGQAFVAAAVTAGRRGA